jgi:hypothetical protein
VSERYVRSGAVRCGAVPKGNDCLKCTKRVRAPRVRDSLSIMDSAVMYNTDWSSSTQCATPRRVAPHRATPRHATPRHASLAFVSSVLTVAGCHLRKFTFQSSHASSCSHPSECATNLRASERRDRSGWCNPTFAGGLADRNVGAERRSSHRYRVYAYKRPPHTHAHTRVHVRACTGRVRQGTLIILGHSGAICGAMVECGVLCGYSAVLWRST